MRIVYNLLRNARYQWEEGLWVRPWVTGVLPHSENVYGQKKNSELRLG